MIRKNLKALLLMTAIFLMLAGCGQAATSTLSYIGLEEARTVAAADAGLTTADVEFTSATLDTRDGTDYYALAFIADGRTYTYEVDALTGVIIESQMQSDEADETQEETAEAADAQDTALSDAAAPEAGSSAEEASTAEAAVEASVSTEAAASEASTSGDAAAETAAAAQTGTAANAAAASTGSTLLTEAEARAAALANAGLTEAEVTFTKTKLDREDGQQVYDVKFYTAAGAEYDYELDASTGEILSCDYELKSTQTATGSTITEAEARAIALAQVPGATDADVRELKLDRDDGQLQYEGIILYDGMEYEFEIDAYSGAIRSWESERAD